jgi:hypothetical protein
MLGLVREHRAISRIDIARLANLSAATVSGITSDLTAEEAMAQARTNIEAILAE